MHPLSSRARFRDYCIVGALGFFVDTGVYSGLVLAGTPWLFSRFVSFSLAVTITFHLNKKISFPSETFRPQPDRTRPAKYLLVQTLGLLMNLSVFFTIVNFYPVKSGEELFYVTYIICGALLALFFTYELNRRFTFAN